jgi:hypothetical protein
VDKFTIAVTARLEKRASVSIEPVSTFQKITHPITQTALGFGGLSDKDGVNDFIARALAKDHVENAQSDRKVRIRKTNPFAMAKKLSKAELSTGERVKRLLLGPFGEHKTATEALGRLDRATEELPEHLREAVQNRAEAHSAAMLSTKAMVLPSLLTGIASRRYFNRQSARDTHGNVTRLNKANNDIVKNTRRLALLGSGWLGRGLRAARQVVTND